MRSEAIKAAYLSAAKQFHPGQFYRLQNFESLAANPEAHYSIGELSIADAFSELPEDMRRRLEKGERGELR